MDVSSQKQITIKAPECTEIWDKKVVISSDLWFASNILSFYFQYIKFYFHIYLYVLIREVAVENFSHGNALYTEIPV